MRRLFRARRKDEYPAGTCTRHAYDGVPWVPLGWGDAYQWADSAVRAGLSVGGVPRHGAIAVWQPGEPFGPYGHVAYVCHARTDGKFCVYERGWYGVPGTSMVWHDAATTAVFVYPPQGVQGRLPRGERHNGRGDDGDPITSVINAYESMRAYYNIGAAFEQVAISAVIAEMDTLL
jgi:hypothetical protein